MSAHDLLDDVQPQPQPPVWPAMVRAGAAHGAVEFFQRLGLDPDKVLERVQLRRAELAELREGLVTILGQIHERADSSQPGQTAPQPRRPDPREAAVRTSKTG